MSKTIIKPAEPRFCVRLRNVSNRIERPWLVPYNSETGAGGDVDTSSDWPERWPEAQARAFVEANPAFGLYELIDYRTRRVL